MKENELKVFTLEAANELLPILNELLGELQRRRDHATEIEVQIDALELVSDSEGATARRELEQLVTKHRRLVGEFYDVVDQIHSYGCFLKDADMGLVDFYGTVDGRMVYFCWRLGEAQVSFWHEIGQGYATRQPLS